MQKIIPHLWFDRQAEDAASFYASVFRNAKVNTVTRYGSAGQEIHGMEEGTVMTVDWEIDGYQFMAINAGPVFTINPSISFMVNFDPSRESDAAGYLDEVWEKLAEGGSVLMPLQEYPFSKRYGWVVDKFGVSWQLTLTDPAGEERPFIIPSLLYVTEGGKVAEEATDFYLSVFDGAKRGTLARYPASMEPNAEGAVMFTDFTLLGQWFTAMDGSAKMHQFAFNEAVSLLVLCEDQAEIDRYSAALSAVPEAEQCGWVKDRYGVSWQIAPAEMDDLMTGGDQAQADRVMAAMLQMKKIDIATLRAAAAGKE